VDVAGVVDRAQDSQAGIDAAHHAGDVDRRRRRPAAAGRRLDPSLTEAGLTSLAVHESKLAIIGCHYPTLGASHSPHDYLLGAPSTGEDAEDETGRRRGAHEHGHRASFLH